MTNPHEQYQTLIRFRIQGETREGVYLRALPEYNAIVVWWNGHESVVSRDNITGVRHV